MHIDQVLAGLVSEAERNDTLGFLESLVVDRDERLVACLARIIKEPSSIESTSRLANLLVALGSEAFIPPLIEVISKGSPGTSPWLADYMYALGSLLADCDEYWLAEEDFVRLLGEWLLSSGGGEISWKAGVILAEIKHPASRPYLLRGATDQSLFHQTRIHCVRAIVGQYPDDAPAILEQLSADADKHVRETVSKQQQWMKRRNLKSDSPTAG